MHVSNQAALGLAFHLFENLVPNLVSRLVSDRVAELASNLVSNLVSDLVFASVRHIYVPNAIKMQIDTFSQSIPISSLSIAHPERIWVSLQVCLSNHLPLLGGHLSAGSTEGGQRQGRGDRGEERR